MTIRRALLAIGVAGVAYAIRCRFRGQHAPKRHPLGGLRCVECGRAGADLQEMGLQEDAYVNPVRKVYDRHRAAVTRTQEWDESTRWNTH